MKYRLSFILLIFILIQTGCREENVPKYKIGVSQCSSDEWRDKINNEMRREMLFHDDGTIEIVSAEDSNEKQIDDIQSFIDRKFDIIIVAPNEAEALTPVVKKAYNAGIPVIIFDRRVTGDSYTSYIDLDNKGIGFEAAKYAHSLLGDDKNEIVEITGLSGSTPAQERHEGFLEGIKAYPGLELVASVDGEWNREMAASLADSLLTVYPDLKLVYAHSDNMAIGVSELFKSKGRNDIKILGTDASPGQGIEAVENGILDATFIYPTEGHRIIRTAYSILENQPFEKTVNVPSLASVDKSNAEILLKQYELLKDETDKVLRLNKKNNELWSRNKTQKAFIHTVLTLAIILVVILILFLVVFIRNRKLQKQLGIQNKHLEEERDKQKELYRRLDEATNSKMAFFTNVSHDLRTPLTLIAEPVDQVSQKDYLEPDDRRLMRLAAKNAVILKRLIDDILDFQKHENGKAELRLSEEKVVARLKEWFSLFNSIAEKRNLQLEFKCKCDEHFSMAVDVEKLERVVFNLLSNAFRYTPDKGHITLECECDKETFKFVVADTGNGIKKEEIDKIFNNFYRGNEVRPKGSGIGLAVTKEFVELHGGKIEVESVPGKGSRFTITLPIKHSENKGYDSQFSIKLQEVERLLEEEKEEFEFEENKPLVLVIDDNEDIRHLLHQLLDSKYNVITASDGKKGLKMAMKYVPDLIICDIMMPEMDGIECCGALKKEQTTSHIPVMMLTACKMDEQRMESYAQGADAFLPKPFKGEVVLSRCANLIANRKRIKDIYSNEGTTGDKQNQMKPNGKPDSLSLENDFYGRFITLIKTRYDDPSLSTESMAQNFNIGGAQLTRKIKALTNYTPVEILRNYRLEQARKLVLTSDKNINEITIAVGFSSAPYLTKCFREHFGITPSEMRNQK